MTKEKVIESIEDLIKSEYEQQDKLRGNQHPSALADYHRSQGRQRGLEAAIGLVRVLT